MQLAATPRPHPPPVPPRPSRQVVAEALKRSPRPPCPTRQAPPPPDTKPWRAKNNTSASASENCIRGGNRTVVYDSGGKTTNGEIAVEESVKKSGDDKIEENVKKQQQVDAVVATLTQSERNDRNSTNFSCGAGLNPTPPSSSSCSSSSLPVIKPKPAERHQQQIISHSNLRVHQIRQCNSPSDPPPPDPKLMISQSLQSAKLVKHQRNIQVVNGAVIFEAENHNVKKSSPFENNNEEIYNSETKLNESLIINDLEFDNNKCFKDSSSSAILSTNDNKTHEEKEEEENEDENEEEEKEESILDSRLENYENEERINKDFNSSSSSNISSDDCATVVQVVDEQERRVAFEDKVNIKHEDWLEAGVRYSSTKITLSGDETQEDTFVNGFHSQDDDELISTFDFDSIKEKIAMSSLQGLPPLPRSLSGFNLNATPTRESNEPPPPPARSSSRPQRGTRPTQPTGRPPPPPQGGRQLTTLDTQLAKLRREMFGLRQLDLSLLSQLWSLNESIQEFRQLLQEQDDRAPSPSPSSEEGDDTSYGSHPPPHPRRPPPVSHHHRTPRPLPRNDSPSSEEYGAV